MIEIQVSHRGSIYSVQIIKCSLLNANIVGRELAESTNASGEPKCSMKEEILLPIVYNNRQQGGEAIESLAQ